MKDLEEIVKLYQEAHEHLNRHKDRISALAACDRASTKLDRLATEHTEAGNLVRKARPQIRQALYHEKSLHKKIEISLGFWTQVAEACQD